MIPAAPFCIASLAASMVKGWGKKLDVTKLYKPLERIRKEEKYVLLVLFVSMEDERLVQFVYHPQQ
uniref:Uncharacterized protein n=1 Tax=Rhizophora mucronata TaxID=61149 RepID=A0A2P2MEE8_RHIMU